MYCLNYGDYDRSKVMGRIHIHRALDQFGSTQSPTQPTAGGQSLGLPIAVKSTPASVSCK